MTHDQVLTIACPEVSVVHDDQDAGLTITVELPGVSKEHIDLTLSKTGFCVEASRADLRYQGCFQFAHECDSEGAKAKFANGLLTIAVPFAEPLCGKKIVIE